MEVLKILALLGIIGLIIYSIHAINEYSKSRYDYKPFQVINLTIIAIPCFISIVLFWALEPNNGGFVDYKDLNHIVLYILVALSCIVVCVSIYNHTKNIVIALYSTIILSVGSIFAALLVIWAIMAALSRSGQKGKR